MKTAMMLSFILSVLLSASCSKSDLSTETMGPDPELTMAPNATVNKSLVLQLVNEIRLKGCQCGDTYYPPANAITWNNQLESAAYNHSADMLKNNYFNHTAPDGSNAGIRIGRAGYSWKAYGENIAMGYRSEKEVVQGWIESSGHCKNMMNKTFTEMGVARAGNYWTQEFATK